MLAAIPLKAAAALPVLAVIELAKGNPGDGLVLVAIGIAAALLVFLCAIPCKYTLGEEALTIQSGILKYKLGYDIITGAVKSCNPLSAPAWSLKRVKIRITKGFGFTLVSPKDRDAFIKDLLSRVADWIEAHEDTCCE